MLGRSGSLNAKTRELIELQTLAKTRTQALRSVLSEVRSCRKEIWVDLEYIQQKLRYVRKLQLSSLVSLERAVCSATRTWITD